MTAVMVRQCSTLFFARLLGWSCLSLLIGCGVKSSPVPPQTVFPAPISDLRASADPAGISLRWSRPMHYVSGHAMRDLGGFVLLRGDGDRPFRPFVALPVTDQERFSPERDFSYLDGETQVGRSYRYTVVSRTTDGYTSAPSNEVRFTREWPPRNQQPRSLALPSSTPATPVLP